MGYSLTVEEVEDILPEVAFLVEEAIAVYEELKETYIAALKVMPRAESDGLVMQNIPKRFVKHIQVLEAELQDVLEEIEELGGEVRDIEEGIVDFPGMFQGRDIYYCWKLGEDKVEHWHPEEGSRRKKIVRLGL